jgi:PAS domain S-box-containing protein
MVTARAQRARQHNTIRRDLQTALYEREREHLALDEHAIVSITDGSGNITYVNDRFCAISGYTRAELVGQNHRIVKSGQHPPAFYATLWGTISGGRVWQGELCNRRKDGRLYWVESTIVPFLNANGRPYQYVSVRTDITRIKTAEATIERQKERLRRGQLTANIGTWEWYIPSGELYWTERIAPLFGYPEGELDTSYDNFLKAVHPDDRQAVIDAVNAAVEHDVPYEIEHRVVWPDGTVRWLLEKGAVQRDADGKPLQMLGVVQDIDDRKRAQLALAESRARLEEAQTLAKLGYWEADMVSGKLTWSDEIYRIFGRDPVSFTPSVESFFAAVHPEDVALVQASERRAEQTGLHDVVHRIVRPDGEVRHVHELARYERDGQQQVVRLIGTVQDVTDLKRIEQALIAARDEAERANRAKSDFLSSMSHELRTPMNAILGFSQLMEFDDNLPAEHKENVREIISAGSHLLQLINEVLDLAKVESGRIALTLEPVDVHALVEESLKLVSTAAEQRAIRVQYTGLEDAVVRADRTRLKQALLNLLSNAVKYNRANGRVEVVVQRTDQGQLRILVRDTGPGIAPDKLGKLFQPFSRLGAEATGVEGTGIGLTITRRIIEMMGGRVDVSSEAGVGSTFWIDLPLEYAHRVV